MGEAILRKKLGVKGMTRNKIRKNNKLCRCSCITACNFNSRAPNNFSATSEPYVEERR